VTKLLQLLLFPILVLCWMLLVELRMDHTLCDKDLLTEIQFLNTELRVDGSCFNRAFEC